MKETKKSRKISVGAHVVRPFSKGFTQESGITMIALIIMIVVIVILSVVVIRGVTEGGLIGTTETAAEDYNVTSYKEQIEEKVRGTVLSYGSKGQEVNMSKIAEELNNETLWVKSAIANIDTSINNEDVIITTVDGYVFQLYYSDTYGAVFVEYIGKDDGKEFPNLKARFEKSKAAIMAEAKGAEKLELIYREEITGEPIEKPSGEQKIEVDGIGTGWYKVRAVSSAGKLRYAWLKVTNISGKLTPPTITVTPEAEEGNNGWYLGSVKVKIETDNPNAKEIHYRQIENGIVTKEDEGYTGEFRIETEGTTKIYAWIEDAEGNSSEETLKEIKIDSKEPRIIHEEESAIPQVGEWYKGNVEITIKGEDEASGIDGYQYMVVGEDADYREKKTLGENGDKLIVEKEGITEIKIKMLDVAGNEKEEIVTIKKDSIAPEFQGSITISDEKLNSFTVNALAYDAVSGNPSNGGRITYEFYITKNGTEEKAGENYTGIFEITGLDMGISYDVRVVATDPAGNTSEKLARGITKINHAPVWLVEPKSVEEKKTNTSIKLTMTAKDDDGDNLTYTIKYGAYNEDGSKGAYIETKEISNVTQGIEQTINITGLSNYTKYYFEVDAVDVSNAMTSIYEFDKQTYCGLAVQCSSANGKSTEFSCGTCGATWRCPARWVLHIFACQWRYV